MIHALYGGGAERLMADLARRWNANHEVHLLTWSKTETDTYSVPKSVHRHSLDLLRISPNAFVGLLSNWKRVEKLREQLRSIQPDFLLSFSDKTNIVTLQAARTLNIPTWISEHSDPDKQRLGALWEFWRKITYRNCTGCTVLTQDIAKTMQMWVAPTKIRVIPPAIIECETRITKEEDITRSILFLGRLSQEKRVDLLIESWRKVHSALPDWNLNIAGDGQERTQLESLASGLPRIVFHGWVDNPQELLSSSQVFALTSDYEGFPVSLLEAMDHSLACLTTHCTGAIDSLNAHTECVLTSPVNDAEAFAENLKQICCDTELQDRLSTAGRKRAKDFYWPEVGKLWDRLLQPQSSRSTHLEAHGSTSANR